MRWMPLKTAVQPIASKPEITRASPLAEIPASPLAFAMRCNSFAAAEDFVSLCNTKWGRIRDPIFDGLNSHLGGNCQFFAGNRMDKLQLFGT